MTRIISWNVNGIRAGVRKGFLEWLEAEQPDMMCIQETKAHPDQLDDSVLNIEGYKSYWASAQKKGYSGTAIWTKVEPLSVSFMGAEQFDAEGRVLVLGFEKFTLINAYYPNSQDERKRLPYKIAFCDEMLKLCNKLVKAGKNIVLCGDYNIAHTEIDLARPKQNQNSAGYYIEERKAMTKFVKAGYVDTFRHFNNEPGNYTWWSYRAGARENNVGWRIDYHCVNEDFMPAVKSSVIMPTVMGSDHCPLALVLE